MSLSAELQDEITDALRDFHVGITDTRHRLAMAQAVTLTRVLDDLDGPRVLHHGCCTGADEAAHRIALSLGWQIVGHPGTRRDGNSPWKMKINPAEFTVLFPPKPYLDRDVDIAEVGRLLIAVPAYPEHYPRCRASGTCTTVRQARERKRPIIYVWADGHTTTEEERHG